MLKGNSKTGTLYSFLLLLTYTTVTTVTTKKYTYNHTERIQKVRFSGNSKSVTLLLPLLPS